MQLTDRCSRTDKRPNPGHARPTPGPNDLLKPKTTAYQFGSSKDVGARVTPRPRLTPDGAVKTLRRRLDAREHGQADDAERSVASESHLRF